MQFTHLARSILCLVFISSAVAGQLSSNREGRPVRSFGTDGYLNLTPSGENTTLAWGYILTEVLSNEKIVVAYPVRRNGVEATMVARFFENGELDTDFGAVGKTFIGGPTNQAFTSMITMPDGKLVLGGSVQHPSDASQFDFLVVRLTPEGQPDGTFNDDGIFTKDFALPGEKGADRASSIARQNDGKIVIGGVANRYTQAGRTNAFGVVMRLLENGTTDDSFGSAGTELHPIGNNLTNTIDAPRETAVIVQSDSKIMFGAVARTYTSKTTPDFRHYAHTFRLQSNGSLDTDFGSMGRVTIPTFGAGYTTLIELPNLKLLSLNGIGLLTRLNANGTVDTTFADAGHYLDVLRPGNMEIAADGKILIAANVTDVTNPGHPRYYGHFRRFFADGERDIRFANSGIKSFELGELTIPGAFMDLDVLADKTVLLSGLRSLNGAAKAFVLKVYGVRKL